MANVYLHSGNIALGNNSRFRLVWWGWFTLPRQIHRSWPPSFQECNLAGSWWRCDDRRRNDCMCQQAPNSRGRKGHQSLQQWFRQVRYQKPQVVSVNREQIPIPDPWKREKVKFGLLYRLSQLEDWFNPIRAPRPFQREKWRPTNSNKLSIISKLSSRTLIIFLSPIFLSFQLWYMCQACKSQNFSTHS